MSTKEPTNNVESGNDKGILKEWNCIGRKSDPRMGESSCLKKGRGVPTKEC